MTDAPLAPLVLDGWFTLHQFFRLAHGPGEHGGVDPDAAGSLQELFHDWEDLGEDGWSGLYRIVGKETDYMAVHFRSSLEELAEAERTLQRHHGAEAWVQVGDYVSVVELGLYAVSAALLQKAEMDDIEVHSEAWDARVEETLATEREKVYTQKRLKPRQPAGMPYVCFYPMDKRRRVDQNWYTLPLPERADLMSDHGRTGRRYAGKVSQIITGSVGFDDWEWAVTLFSEDPHHFKSLVTEMRYDLASSLYAEFGPFWVGHRVEPGEIAESLTR